MRLFQLRAKGLGYRQVAKLAGLSPRTVVAIGNGSQEWIELDTERRILECQPILAHGTQITGWREWRLLDSLRTEGFSDSEIARRLGYKTPRLQLHRTITVKNALRVRTLYRRVNAEGPAQPGEFTEDQQDDMRHYQRRARKA